MTAQTTLCPGRRVIQGKPAGQPDQLYSGPPARFSGPAGVCDTIHRRIGMFNLGGPEIIVILVVALLVIGPDKLPNFMRTVGKAIGELRRVSTDFQQTMSTSISADPSDPARPEKVETPIPYTDPHTPDTDAVTSPARKRALPRARRARRPSSRANGDQGQA